MRLDLPERRESLDRGLVEIADDVGGDCPALDVVAVGPLLLLDPREDLRIRRPGRKGLGFDQLSLNARHRLARAARELSDVLDAFRHGVSRLLFRAKK